MLWYWYIHDRQFNHVPIKNESNEVFYEALIMPMIIEVAITNESEVIVSSKTIGELLPFLSI